MLMNAGKFLAPQDARAVLHDAHYAFGLPDLAHYRIQLARTRTGSIFPLRSSQKSCRLPTCAARKHFAATLENVSTRWTYRSFAGDRHAEMVVEVAYTSPDQKEFRIVSQSGSKVQAPLALLRHVWLRLLESEKEALQNANRQRWVRLPTC